MQGSRYYRYDIDYDIISHEIDNNIISYDIDYDGCSESEFQPEPDYWPVLALARLLAA